MAGKPERVAARNKLTGKLWVVNAGTAAHKRVVKGLAIGEFESASLPKRGGRAAKSAEAPSTDGE